MELVIFGNLNVNFIKKELRNKYLLKIISEE